MKGTSGRSIGGTGYESINLVQRSYPDFWYVSCFCLLMAVVFDNCGEYTGRKAVFPAGGRAMGAK